MIAKPRALKIALIVAGLCIAAGLIYFLGDKSPPIVSGLVVVGVVFFLTLMRKAGVYKSPTFRRLAMGSSRTPLRDFALAVVCFLATVAVTLAILAGVNNNVLPDNKMTEGILLVVIFAGIAVIMFFMSGVIGRFLEGPPPP
jgi:hypothetical protein